jgi:hypothetical protein
VKLALTTFCLVLSALLSESPGPESRAHCNLAALSSAERARDRQLVPTLASALRERAELADGYAYRFDRKVLKELGEWLDIEAKCCQPLKYELALEPQPGGALWVRITGHEAKEFIGAEFAPLTEKLASQDPRR